MAVEDDAGMPFAEWTPNAGQNGAEAARSESLMDGISPQPLGLQSQ
jgi:hypothetical protein